MIQQFSESQPGFVLGSASAFLGLVIGTAFGPVAGQGLNEGDLDLEDAKATADDETDWHLPEGFSEFLRGLIPRSAGSDDSSVWYIFAGLIVLGVVGAYIRNAAAVASFFVVTSLLLTLAALIVFATLKRRGVIAGAFYAYAFLSGLFFSACGVLVGVELIYPRAGGSYLRAIRLSVAHHNGVLGAGLDAILFILYQLLGAFLLVLAFFAYICLAVSAIAATYIGCDAVGRPLWRLLYFLTKWSFRRGVVIFAAVLAVGSVLLASGEVEAWVTRDANVHIPRGPASTNTPAPRSHPPGLTNSPKSR